MSAAAAAGESALDRALALLTPEARERAEALGADAVGMSTVHETIVARHCGMRVAAVSAITNLAEGMSADPLSHEQTLRDGARAAADLAPLVARFAGRC